MQANPDKFQAICIGGKKEEENICFDREIDGIRIQPEKEVKLLGFTIDLEIWFSSHISNICKKAS